MTDAAPPSHGQDVRARLTRVAQHAPLPDGDATTVRVLTVNRRRRLHAGRWVAAAVAVLVLGAAATLAPPADPVARAPVTAAQVPPPPALYDQAPRGSLADDPQFLTGVAALPWSPLPTSIGSHRLLDPGSTRVVYAADVPGGRRWAVVLARSGALWLVDWFAGPAGAGPEQLTEASPPALFSLSEPLALLDLSADTGPLVVLAAEGAEVEYSATLDRGDDGTLGREFQPLRPVDGVPLGLVTTPITYDPQTSAIIDLVQDGVRHEVHQVLATGTPPWARADADPGRPDPAAAAACLTAAGFVVQAAPPSAGLYYQDPRSGQLSSLEQADRDRTSRDCLAAGRD